MNQKYATADTSGNINGFYDSEINGANIPAGTVEITNPQWQDCLANPGKWLIQAGVLVAAPNWPPPAPPPAPGVRGFRMAIPLDSSVPASDLSALMSDPRAGQFLWAIQDSNWPFAQILYNSMKATPGTGYTASDVESFGNLAVAHFIPITP